MDSDLGCSLRQQAWTAKISCKIHKLSRKRLCRISLRIGLLLSAFRANMCTTERENTQNETEDSTMNEKVARQIEEMKKQTIGVEVEMNNITREKAAKVAARYFGTRRYENTAGRNGYSTWSAWDAQGREWKFQKDVSIEGLESEKCEMVTPILTYSDMETLQELIRQLRHAGAKSDATRGCGVHIHIGAKGHTPQTLRNLANIMASHESLIADALNLDRGRMRRYCRTVDPRFLEQLNRRKPTTMTQLADIWYGSHNANYGRSHHYNDSRYHMLNYHATFTKGTVEFRLFQFDAPSGDRRGGLHAGQLKSYIQLCLALSQMAKMVKTASPKPQQNENPKYAMRTWLLRLGFIGDEFKTAREILTKRLAGDTAFRRGRDAA
nr:MAG TPA: Putative amidoligase enzyme [Caudoviricetes sp.]